MYVALSRSRGRETIRILRPFDDSILLRPVDEELRVEEERLEQLYDTIAWPLGKVYGHPYDAFKLALT